MFYQEGGGGFGTLVDVQDGGGGYGCGTPMVVLRMVMVGSEYVM